MAAMNTRSSVYKVALLLIYLTFLLFALSLGNPFWFGPDNGIFGLWTVVEGDDFVIDKSEAYGFGEGPLGGEEWFEGVRACWVGGTLFYIIGIISSLVENCGATRGKDYGITGVFILLAGLSGAAGVIVTVIKIHDKDGLDEFRWGFYIACIASGLAILFAIILLISRNANSEDTSKSSRTADYVYAHKHPGPYTADYSNQGYRNDELPLVNGVNGVAHSLYRGNNGYGNGNGYGHNSNSYGQGPRVEPISTYNPYGYKDHRPSNRSSMADSADLSNGFTSNMIHAEHSLGRRREDYGRSGINARNEPAPRNDYYYGNGRGY